MSYVSTKHHNRDQLRGRLFMMGFGLLWVLGLTDGVSGYTQDLALVLLLCGVLGLVVTYRQIKSLPAPKIVTARRKMQAHRFNMVGMTEAGGIFLVVVAANALSHAVLIPSLVMVVVGLHFLPLAKIFDVKAYVATGLTLITIGVGALLLSVSHEYSIAPQQIASLATACVLYLTAWLI